MNEPRAYDESARAILEAMSHATITRAADGTVEFELRLPPETIGPLFRATMRAEAELLLDDADSAGADIGLGELRTPGQRRADALVAVILAAGDALD